MVQGTVLQGIGGFYYVETADAVYECKARGAFRNEGLSPLAGDRVAVTVQENGKGVVEEILPRKNALVRPPVANLDQLAIVTSVVEPRLNPLLVDKMVALAEIADIEPLIVISKTDLGDAGEWEAIYRTTGLSVFTVTSTRPETAEPLKMHLQGKITAFTGNSGVGKSSLLNAIDPALCRETGEISQKLGRGRHTTRSAILLPLDGGGYLVDTPGFSALDLARIRPIEKEELPFCFREFEPFFGKCRFTGCAHLCEPDCAVRAAVEAGVIARSRYDSYAAMYEEARQYKKK